MAVRIRASSDWASGPPDCCVAPSSLASASAAIRSLDVLSIDRREPARLDLAPRGRGEDDVQQAPLDVRADDDLHRRLVDRHSSGSEIQAVVSLAAEPLVVLKTVMPYGLDRHRPPGDSRAFSPAATVSSKRASTSGASSIRPLWPRLRSA